MRPLLLLCLAATSIAAAQPNFSGVWKLAGTNPPEIYIVDQRERELRVVMFVDNDSVRTLDVKGPIDGQPHPQTVNNAPCIFTARWEGDNLYWETRREPPEGVRHNRRWLQLSADGRVVSAIRTRMAPGPQETWTEKWEKQDPPAAASFTSAFALRKLVNSASPNGLSAADGVLARGALAAAFNDLPQLERELLPLLHTNPKAPQAESARLLLAGVYRRNGKARKALQYCDTSDRAFLEQLSKYPEPSLAHGAVARVQAVRGQDGQLILPVMVGGKDGAYQIDTGSNMSLLRLSEASRLGLKLEPVTKKITDVTGLPYDAYLTVVPTLSIGPLTLKHVPFWVVEDGRLSDVTGLLGIDVLLLLRTLRWTSKGVVEVGFPPQPRDLAQANLSFEGDYPVAEVSSNLTFYLDTGFTDTHLYAPFAARFLDQMAARGKQANYEMNGEAGHSTLRDLILPEVTLRIGGLDTTLHDAAVLLERAPDTNEWHHGRIGIDALNLAQTVTLDLQAMRLELR